MPVVKLLAYMQLVKQVIIRGRLGQIHGRPYPIISTMVITSACKGACLLFCLLYNIAILYK